MFRLVSSLFCTVFLPFPDIVFCEDGDHSLYGAQDSAVDNNWPEFIISIFPKWKYSIYQ